MKYADLHQAVQSAAGFRLRAKLQPFYGAGEIIFPATVAGGKYQISDRRIPGYENATPCVIIDSVQSQANRLENALLADIREGKLKLPHIETDFSQVDDLSKPVGKLTCFDCPHRAFDAILRDSVDEKEILFPLTDAGIAIVKANSANATALFQISPGSLLFGSWDSTGLSGGLGEKFTRCVVSEVVGVNCLQAERGGFRVDPLNSSAAVDCAEIAKEEKYGVWGDRQGKTKKDKGKASVVNHGNILIDATHGGVTVDHIRLSTAISFPAIRQLRFPVGGKDLSSQAHAVLTAMALHAAALNLERGWHLRSRCDLVLADKESLTWELLGKEKSADLSLTADETRELLLEAITAAKDAGLPWNEEPIKLTPSPALRKLVVKSQKLQRESATAE